MWDEGMVDWKSREVSVGELGNKGIGDQGIREGGEGNENSKWFDHELKAVVDYSMEIDDAFRGTKIRNGESVF